MYTSLEELTEMYLKYGQDIDERSAVRKGFTNRPIGSVQYITVLHSFLNTCNWFLKAMSIVDSKLVLCDIRNLRINISVVLVYHINLNHISLHYKVYNGLIPHSIEYYRCVNAIVGT